MLYLMLMFLVIAGGASLLGFEETASQFLILAEILLGLFLVLLTISGLRKYFRRKN